MPAIAANRLLHGLTPKSSFWRPAQFDTIRLAQIKRAGLATLGAVST
jgi:hypothetical protein